MSELPLQPPFDNSAVAAFYRGRGCPFGARFFAVPPGGVLRFTRTRDRLRPGVVIEIRVITGDFIGRVQRYEVMRRLVASSLCLYPTEQRPRACPPG